jgi:hypothetical protein
MNFRSPAYEDICFVYITLNDYELQKPKAINGKCRIKKLNIETDISFAITRFLLVKFDLFAFETRTN